MSLRFALLSLLSRASMTGYDLTKQFDSTIGNFWHAKHSQIYPELASLTKEGLLTYELVTQTSKPNKKVYTITDAGREALANWMSEPADIRSVKDSLILRIWLAGQVDPSSLLPQLRSALEGWEQRLRSYREVEAATPQALEPSPENTMLGCAMALHIGIMQAETYRNWLRWSIDKLEAVNAARQSAPRR
ncbi:MAG TPA: PadR family transcriptional regulator [Oscillatoriaceae cyanobacterium]